MPPKKAAAAQVNGVKPTSKATPRTTSKTTTSKSAATTKSGTAKPAPVKAVTKKTAAPVTSPTETKATTKTKRKASEDAPEPATNGVKRRKSSKESIEPPVIKKKAVKEPAKSTASKRPKTVKAKVILNEVPTQRLDVYVFGTGDNGELGLGGEKGQVTVKRPRLNPLLAADKFGVVQMAIGGSHCAALTHDNKILTWGVNDEGALGRDVTWDAPTRDIDDDKSENDSDDDSQTGINPKEATPTEIDMSAFPEDTVFTQLVAGDSMTFALTDEGLVWGWGTFRVCAGSRPDLLSCANCLVYREMKVSLDSVEPKERLCESNIDLFSLTG